MALGVQRFLVSITPPYPFLRLVVLLGLDPRNLCLSQGHEDILASPAAAVALDLALRAVLVLSWLLYVVYGFAGGHPAAPA